MTPHPSNDALLSATIDYLATELLPTLDGEHRFKTLLAVNALKILQRGLQANLAVPQDDAGIQPQASATEIRQGHVAVDDARLLEALEASLRQSLQINNPKWIRSD